MAKHGKKKRGGCTGLLLVVVAVLGLGAAGLWWWGGQDITAGINNAKGLLSQASPWLKAGMGQDTGSADNKKVAYSFALLADSHEDTTVFPKIVDQIEARQDISFVGFLGDASNAGEDDKLRQAKNYLDNITVPVHVLPGDHDMNWLPHRDLSNFKQIFGISATSYSFTKNNQTFIFLDNSDSVNGVSAATMTWLRQTLDGAKDRDIYIFLSTPLYNPYLSFKAMGSQSESVKAQADDIGKLLKEYPVKVMFAGDTHSFSEYTDKTSGKPVVTVGAAGTNKNLLPMYVLVEIFEDGTYNASSVPYKE